MAAAGPVATVVQPSDVAAELTADGVTVRQLADTGGGATGGLVRRLIEIPAGSQLADAAPGAQLWFVLGGSGQISLPDQAGRQSWQLGPDQGMLLPTGTRYRLTGPLHLDVVTLPEPATPLPGPDSQQPAAAWAPLVRDLAACPVERTGDRHFRVLFGPGRDCQVATQFVGEIPPGRAPEHSHPYDEVVLVLAGDGVAHAGGAQHALARGTCIHLPPGVPHCLENTGPRMLRVLGVFHPADSPAAKLAPAGEPAQSSAE
ncbi:MAG TPA: cupin domain-containing protein [Streptosporangiaceae bacterium]|nr:cupin domain-containing protein [Streptosporangiaceae bacterium]